MYVNSLISRPKAIEVREHPLLWDSDKRLSFLRDTSDVVEKYPHLLKELDETKQDIARIKYHNRRLVSTWMKTMPGGLIDHMLEYRKYDFVKVSELLRFIRNAYGHYKEFPGDIKVFNAPSFSLCVVNFSSIRFIHTISTTYFRVL